MLSDASAVLTGRSWPAIPAYLLIAAVLVADVALLTWTRRGAQWGLRDGTSRMLAIAALGLFASLPRLKPYSFGLMFVPLYLGAKTLSITWLSVLVLATCVMPFLARWAGAAPGAARIWDYGQLAALIAAYVILRFAPFESTSGLQGDILPVWRRSTS